MLTSLLKGVFFVVLMFFYSIGVWRVVNDYFRREFKSYIDQDPDVIQDKTIKTILTPTPSSVPVLEATTVRMPSEILMSGDYNDVTTFGQSIGPRKTGDAYANAAPEVDAETTTISITSKSIEQPSSSSNTVDSKQQQQQPMMTTTTTTTKPTIHQSDAATTGDTASMLIELSATTLSANSDDCCCDVDSTSMRKSDQTGIRERRADAVVIGGVDAVVAAASSTAEASTNAISSGNQNEMNESTGSAASTPPIGKSISSSSRSHDVKEVRNEVEYCKFSPPPPEQ